jgi:N-acetylmuramoyl-L-alanine amidase
MKFFGLLLLTFSISSFAKVVLIDPGHGGEEVGAIGHLDKHRKVYEKNLSLRLSQKIKNELSKSVTTYMTRSLDRPVTLQERADLADLVKADLFLSIHFNSSTARSGHGFELYYLDNNSNVANNKVEKSENMNLKGEELVINQILIDLVVDQTVTHSRALANKVHEKIRPVLGKHKVSDRGIKPGLFYVLALSKRPGLLIEAGFVSNENELKKVNSEAYLNDLARAIAAGVAEFVKSNK